MRIIIDGVRDNMKPDTQQALHSHLMAALANHENYDATITFVPPKKGEF